MGATQLVFETQFWSPRTGIIIDPPPIVRILDAAGNVMTSATNPITLSLTGGGGDGTLSGTLTVSAGAGVAYFTDASIDRPGTGYRLTATSPGLTSAQSVTFDVSLGFGAISAGGSFIASGQSSGHSCAVSRGGDGYCWGANSFGQLGDGTTTDRLRPTLVSGGHRWSHISAGGHHSCGMTTEGAVYCWGRNSHGQLGDNSTTQRTQPTFVMATTSASSIAVRWLSAGDLHTCFSNVTSSQCWGLNSSGQLGDGTTTDRSVPTLVSGGHEFKLINADSSHTCGSLVGGNGGRAFCWGSNDGGKLGNGSNDNSPTPVAVGSGGLFEFIMNAVAGAVHSCAYGVTARTYCWGRGDNSQLGTGSTSTHSTPQELSGRFISLTAGSYHSCAHDIGAGGGWFCWGSNTNNQLGDGTNVSSATPVRIAGGHNFVLLDAGRSHTCGIVAGGDVYCWGLNTFGQLGDGTTTQRAIPTRVIQ